VIQGSRGRNQELVGSVEHEAISGSVDVKVHRRENDLRLLRKQISESQASFDLEMTSECRNAINYVANQLLGIPVRLPDFNVQQRLHGTRHM